MEGNKEIAVTYDLFITKVTQNNVIEEYSLYDEKHKMNIPCISHLKVNQNIDLYHNYRLINGVLTELTQAEKEANKPKPIPTEQDKVNANLMLEIAKLKTKVGAV